MTTTKHFDSNLLTGGILYGPFHARRRGTVVGVNLLPEAVKICNFDCIYCHCGLSDKADLKKLELCPPLSEVKTAVADGLVALQGRGVELNTIIISGNGEPTLYPEFPDAVDAVLAARNRYAPQTVVTVLTNGTMLHKPAVTDALARVDARVLKLDAGHPDLYEAIDRPLYPFGTDALLKGAKGLGRFSLQSIFLHGRADNTTDAAVSAWIELVAQLKPTEVEIYSVDRKAPVDNVNKVPIATLTQIKEQLESQTGIEGRLFD